MSKPFEELMETFRDYVATVGLLAELHAEWRGNPPMSVDDEPVKQILRNIDWENFSMVLRTVLYVALRTEGPTPFPTSVQ